MTVGRAVAVRGVLSALACALALLFAGDSRAQEAGGAGWEHVGTGMGGFARLWTPASGAFLANSDAGAVRSDDGGLTWRPLPAPPELAGKSVQIWAVNPLDHQVYYVGAKDSDTFRTTDDGATWTRFDIDGDATVELTADPNLVFRYASSTYSVSLARSRDGGATWEPLSPPLDNVSRTAGPSCRTGVHAFYAHPTDPNVVAIGAGCYTTKDFGSSMSISADGGDTWSTSFNSSDSHPTTVAGGYASAPDRLYLLGGHSQGPGSPLFRSDDRGTTWKKVASFGDGRSATRLTVDPSNPDRLFVRHAEAGIKVSTDGGTTWEPFAGPTGGIAGLAVGIDGKYVFASNKEGLHRLPQP